ncbi:MAG: hypothetical protein FJY37_18790 [Betaproteobacteria bacterium]|nr:hypothetical protein [Betaproteobacteria bacterium]
MFPSLRKTLLSAAFGVLAITATSTGITASPQIHVDNNSFRCIKEMAKVREFYVDNLIGNLEGTVLVAKAGSGEYPPGSVLQVMPNEVMVKHHKGFSPITNDWEFLWIDNDKNDSTIFTRGAAEVNNRLGLNCFACHAKARPEHDMVCETTNGCDPIPVTREMFHALQNTDPRCAGSENVSAKDQESLRQLGEIVKALTGQQSPEAWGRGMFARHSPPVDSSPTSLRLGVLDG